MCWLCTCTISINPEYQLDRKKQRQHHIQELEFAVLISDPPLPPVIECNLELWKIPTHPYLRMIHI